jgi:hypothetical protein
MARYYDEAVDFANIIKDKNRLKAQIAGLSDTVQIGKTTTELVKVTDFNLVVKQKDTSTDTRWGLFNWGEANWDNTYDAEFIEVSRLKWLWQNETDLGLGSYDENIDITNGDIRLA